jgi:hypothetical protein
LIVELFSFQDMIGEDFYFQAQGGLYFLMAVGFGAGGLNSSLAVSQRASSVPCYIGLPT